VTSESIEQIFIIIMAYPVVSDDGHGGAHNPPRINFWMFIFLFQWLTFTLVAGEFFS